MKLKRNMLSMALASALLTMAAGVQAQDDTQPAADETAADEAAKRRKQGEGEAVKLDSYEVTGFMRSIEKAVLIKQESNSIVEAISAEDIGKLPDISIADSISRLPGLTAQRVAGRASTINIRGLAGDFSTTLLNGREQVSAGDNRGVEFDQYPSELISGVLVYKTPDATLPAQGISGTVDLRTVRPLSYVGPRFSVNARLEQNSLGELNDGFGDRGNRLSATYIDNGFADGRVGLAIGIARLDSPGQFREWEAWGFPTATINGSEALVLGGNKIKAGSVDNVRTGVMAVLEFEPNDVYRGAIDVYYSKFERAETTRWLEFGLGWSGATLSNPQVENGIVVGGSWAGVRPVVRTDLSEFDDKLFAIGFNNQFKFNDDWRGIADFSLSRADRNQEILEVYAGAPTGDNAQFTLDPRNGPARYQFGFDYGDPARIGLTDPGGWGQDGYVKYPNIDDKLRSARLAVERSFVDGHLSGIEAGVHYSNREKSRESDEFFLDLKDADFVAIPPELLGRPTRAAFANTNIIAYDTRAVVARFHNFRPNLCRDCAAKNWTVEEEIVTPYVQFNIDTAIGSVPVRGNFGLQYVDVDQESTGLGVIGGDGSRTTVTHDGDKYSNVLPSLNLAFTLPHDQFIRFGAARQLARPRMDHMRMFADYGIDTTKGIWSGSGGNARLRPWQSDSFDLSYEKYFGYTGYVSAAVFHKDLKTYIYEAVNTQFDFSIFDLSAFTGPNRPASTIGEFRQQVNGEGGSINGWEFAASLPIGEWVAPLQGFGLIANYSDTRSSIQPNGPGTTQTLPGLSRYVSNVTAYYERGGFSTRVSRRARSDFRGEIQGFGADRETQFIRGEAIVDFQIGYSFAEGSALTGMTVLLQVNNLTNEEYREFFRDPGVVDRPRKFVEYGRTLLVGVNYKF
ncbi:TonB-dependent receptor [Rehaibacterium terrae]|uniref:Iron complex outermembrane receptor protein n=1 Tax=Rehaibacterium terrae TaxID=1341696 RepID=A0A7W7XY80_9GAMM|nr:iron complex outermembrane receptor protein [Rehaibacterium terrae]